VGGAYEAIIYSIHGLNAFGLFSEVWISKPRYDAYKQQTKKIFLVISLLPGDTIIKKLNKP
jgi:hypothetical protein